MTDSLRDKIAAVILANLLEHFKPWTDTREVFRFWAKEVDAPPDEAPHSVSHNLRVIAERLADAVIREMGLEVETGIEVRHSMPPFEATRYVTRWEINETD